MLPPASQARLCPLHFVLLPWLVPPLLASLPLLLPPSSLSFSKLVVLVPAPEDDSSSPRASPHTQLDSPGLATL